KNSMFQDCSALQATEKPFHEILGQKYPHSPHYNPENQVDNSIHYHGNNNRSSSSSDNAAENSWI
ncbi:hypothetical protein MKW92_047586, partial [Papaver armeniacum]